jgi:nucleotide-binding universal stress UspA family protein
MDSIKILLPYNFTDLDQKALAFVSNVFSHFTAIEVTLFSVFTSAPNIEMKDSPVMRKMHENLRHLNQLRDEQEEALQKAKQLLVKQGFSESSVRILFKPKHKDTASHIIETAIEENHDVVVINRRAGKMSRFFVGSVFNKVIPSLKDKTICVVT